MDRTIQRTESDFHVTPREPELEGPDVFIAVLLDKPGVVSVGPYVAGQIYRVPAAEARRLIGTKGFSEVKK